MTKEIERKRPNTVNMLLNPKVFNGRNEGRTAPLFAALFFIFLPLILLGKYIILLFITFGSKVIILSILIYLFYCWKVIAKLLLREKERVLRFQNEQINKYSSISDITYIKRIYDDGCIEYLNGNISYFIVCKNGNKSDPIIRGKELEKFFSLISEFKFNIHVLNIVDTNPLSKRYENIATFKDRNIAESMMEIIDYNKKYVDDNSLIVWTIYEITGTKYEKIKVKNIIQNSLNLLNNRIYREAQAADKQLASYILNRIMTTEINFDEIFTNRYCKGEYYRNKIIGYDTDYMPNSKNKENIYKEDILEWIPKL